MISSDGWFNWTIKLRPSPVDKNTNAGISSAKGIFMHSAEGYASVLLDPNSPFGYNGNNSWHLSNLKDGRVVQHYPLTARCHHATAANQEYIGIENEGRGADAQGNKLPPNLYEHLTELQITNAVRFIREISEWKGWIPKRPISVTDITHTLWEHNEVVRLGGSGTSCPTDRIPWDEILRKLNPIEEDSDSMYIVSKAKTGDADAFKSYLVRGKEFRHIPNATTFDALALLELELYEPNKIAWDFMIKEATIIE